MAQSNSNNKEEKTNTDAVAVKPQDDGFLITGLGASAGGIQAFQEFFRNVPEKSGIAYVVILHLSPDHDSKLAQVLQSATKIPVTQVTEKVKVEPDHVYVVLPNQHLIMQDGSIVVSMNTQIEDRRAPVDIFFRTLAEEHGSSAIAVVLSGTGANGSMGLKRVKERGGCTFVKNPREAEFNEMPRNAIATGLVDQVLNVADIPAKIIAYKNNLGKIQIAEESEKRPQDQQQALREIFIELRARTSHDFTNYKRPTLLRRIERRINIHNLPDLSSYVSYLRQNPEETKALLRDLLISVTNFFRDKKAFDVIETEILPMLIKGKTNEQQLRIWVAGCATGEEAYSLGIICAEKISGIIDAPKIQIFATDIDEAAIAQAREGLYSINDLADVSPERLRRFFIKEGDGYRIRREVRETVMFANHNFLKDPPFSHLDLVSCRNVLIYLNNVAQERVAETFHFALNPGGFLFLGPSESVDGATDLYATYNREHHIFQSRQAAPRNYPIPESVPNFNVDSHPVLTAPSPKNKTLERISFGELHQQLLEQYAPPSLVVNEEYDIVHLTDRVGRFLQISGGEPSSNLLKLIRPELRLELRTLLFQAGQRQTAVEVKGLKIKIDDQPETINIHARPVLRAGHTAKGFILVLFETATDAQPEQEVLLASDEPVARHLEEELMRLKAQLREANEQHAFQQEELKASNEELQAMNEELRSAAEELETSKEELQSINEELRTVNQELKVKVEETSLSSNNLQNLINSTNIGTIFLDRSLRVALFTPAARDIFNLITGDYGRPLSDITHKLDYPHLLEDAETVLEKLAILEREVSTSDKVFLMRISPYRTSEDRINGVVVTFVDITERKLAEHQLEENVEELSRFNNTMVSRELRMIELKKEINKLYKRLGETERYPLNFEKEANENDA
jgi:chemotaxis methyl-accepting protein methylase